MIWLISLIWTIHIDSNFHSCRHYISINLCSQWRVTECMVSREMREYNTDINADATCLTVMHTDVYATLDKMTVSPNINARMATKDLFKRSPNTERKRRNRQVRVELSVNGTPRLTPSNVGISSIFSSFTRLTRNGIVADVLEDKLLVHLFPFIRLDHRARSRDNSTITRRGSRRMAVTSTMGIPSQHRRRAESDTSSCENKRCVTPEG